MEKPKNNSNKKMTLNTERSRLQISNSWIYYGMIIDRYSFQIFGGVCHFSLNAFIDTICNPRNHNWSQESREANFGLLTSALYLGSASGSLFVGLLTGFNTRHLYTVLRVLTGLSIIPIVFGSLPWMVFGRFCLGFFFDAGMEVSIWSMHQILLPRHKDRVLTLYYFMASITYFLWNFASIFDNGGKVYWRMCFLVHSGLLVATAIASLMLFPYINSLSYLMKSEEGENSVIEIISNYYTRETAAYLVKKHKEEFEDLLYGKEGNEVDNLGMGSISGPNIQQGQQKYFPNLATANIENGGVKNIGNSNRKRKRDNKAIESFMTFFKDLKIYSKESIHIVIFSIASMLCFHETIYTYSIYYGAKELNRVEAVKETKKYLIAAGVTKMVSCFVVGFWALTRHRRLALLLSHFATLFFLALIGVAFFIENLRLSRIVLAIFPIGTAGLYATNIIYANDICPPSLFALNHFLVRGVPILFGAFLLPYYLKFEQLSYQEVAWRIFGLVAIGLVCFVWLLNYMVESSEISRVDVFRYFRGGKLATQKKFEEDDLFLEVLSRQSHAIED